MKILVATLVILVSILACASSEATQGTESGSMATRQALNAFSKQVKTDNLVKALVAPGDSAERSIRSSSATGSVIADSRRIDANAYTADVSVLNPFGRETTVPNVQFAVPVSDGDVVSIEIVGGDPRNGVYGKPVRPLGPNVVYFSGPDTPAEWTADTTAQTALRAANTAMQSYVIPVNPLGRDDVHAPYETSENQIILFTLPDHITIQTNPAAAYVDVAATLNAGLKITRTGGEDSTHAIRDSRGYILMFAFSTDANGNTVGTYLTVNNGVDSIPVRNSSPVFTRSYGDNEYIDMVGAPLSANGQHILFSRWILSNQNFIGDQFQLSLVATVPIFSNLEYFKDGVWEALPEPESNEEYYIWLGLSFVRADIVELGTGSRR